MPLKKRIFIISFLIILIISFSGTAFSQTAGDQVGSTFITPYGSVLESTARVDVKFLSREALHKLTRQGYIIDNVRADVVTVYANQEELDWLDKAGYEYRIVEWQPKQPVAGSRGLGGYHDYTTLTSDLEDYADDYPNICRLISLGQSVEELELWAMLISDNPDDEEDEPEFKYVSTIHGDEPLGTEMCLYFIDKLLTEYGVVQRITDLVDSTAIWIVPLINPDGLTYSTRKNANNKDLNRRFPAYYSPHFVPPGVFKENLFHGPPLDTTGFEPEVAHIINWSAENSFVLSANFHTGTLVVWYPYGDNEMHPDEEGWVDTPTPDDLLFEDISERYSIHNGPMWDENHPPEIVNGIGNSADSYTLRGTQADWNYPYVSDNEVCIELSFTKKPPESEIPTYWEEYNKESMLSYLEAVHIGVRGIITNSVSGEPLYAEVWVEGNYHPVYTDPDVGDYHRMLLPGTYNLAFYAPGYAPSFVESVTLTEEEPTTRVDVQLVPGMIDPVNWWKFDEGSGTRAEDPAGNNGGDLIGDPTWVEIRDWCLDFDGDDYVSLDNPIDALTGDMVTISAWIKVDHQPSGWYPIVTQYDDNGHGYYFYLYNEYPAFWLNSKHAVSEEAIVAGDWCHLAGTYNYSQLKIYVNGCLKDKANLEDNSGIETAAYIGHDHVTDPPTYRYFTGCIDDVRVYDLALHMSDIWELMFSDASVFGVKNSLGKYVACFDSFGNLCLKGSLTEGEGQTRPTATGDDEFIFKDSSGNLMIINTTNGNMDIYGSQQSTWQAPSGENDFIVEDSEGPVAYIDESGNLYLEGELYENPE